MFTAVINGEDIKLGDIILKGRLFSVRECTASKIHTCQCHRDDSIVTSQRRHNSPRATPRRHHSDVRFTSVFYLSGFFIDRTSRGELCGQMRKINLKIFQFDSIGSNNFGISWFQYVELCRQPDTTDSRKSEMARKFQTADWKGVVEWLHPRIWWAVRFPAWQIWTDFMTPPSLDD